MCRFLLLKSKIPIQPGEILSKFSTMAKNSKALDGDWQGDGWGICWLSQDKNWQLIKSISPIWEEEKTFIKFSKSRLFLIHARSASFPHHKGVEEFNQPFIKENFAYVFNGLLKGVSLPNQVTGRIGSQKIWGILLNLLRQSPPKDALIKLRNIFFKNSRQVQALNIGLCDKKNIFAYCYYSTNPEYYNLQFHDSPSLKMISSEPLEGFEFKPIAADKVLTF